MHREVELRRSNPIYVSEHVVVKLHLHQIDERFLSRIGMLVELQYSCHMMSSSLLDYSVGNSWDAHGITHSRSFLSESQLACLVVWQIG